MVVHKRSRESSGFPAPWTKVHKTHIFIIYFAQWAFQDFTCSAWSISKMSILPERCRRNRLFRNHWKMHSNTLRYITLALPQYGLSKKLLEPLKYNTFCSRGLKMASHKLLTSTSLWLKKYQIGILKNQKSPPEAQFGQARNAFGATHSEWKRK